jgi:hypothetical protein
VQKYLVGFELTNPFNNPINLNATSAAHSNHHP